MKNDALVGVPYFSLVFAFSTASGLGVLTIFFPSRSFDVKFAICMTYIQIDKNPFTKNQT